MQALCENLFAVWRCFSGAVEGGAGVPRAQGRAGVACMRARRAGPPAMGVAATVLSLLDQLELSYAVALPGNGLACGGALKREKQIPCLWEWAGEL